MALGRNEEELVNSMQELDHGLTFQMMASGDTEVERADV